MVIQYPCKCPHCNKDSLKFIILINKISLYQCVNCAMIVKEKNE